MALMQLPGHGFGMAAGLCHWLCSQLGKVTFKMYSLEIGQKEKVYLLNEGQATSTKI